MGALSHTRVDGLRAQAEDHQAPSTEEHGGNWSTTCLSPRLVWSVITAPRQAHENLAAPSPCPLVPVEPSPSSDKLGVRPAIERPEQHPPVRSCGFDPMSPTGSALALRAYCLIGFSAERRTCIVGGRPRGHNETAKPFLDHAMDWSDTARAQAAQRWRHAATPAKREWNGKEQGIPVGRNTGSIWPRVENNEGRIRSGGNHVQGLLGGRFLARRLPKRAWDRWPDLPRQIYHARLSHGRPGETGPSPTRRGKLVSPNAHGQLAIPQRVLVPHLRLAASRKSSPSPACFAVRARRDAIVHVFKHAYK